jgi:hypothetical protein
MGSPNGYPEGDEQRASPDTRRVGIGDASSGMAVGAGSLG